MVWAIGLIRPVRVRALVYSLPIPMTLVLAGGTVRVDGAQVVGVLLLVAFLAVTAFLHVRMKAPAVLAVVTAAAGYVLVAWALPARLPLLPCLLAVAGLWLVGVLVRPTPEFERPAPPPLSWPVAAAKLTAVLAASFSMVWLGGLLAGLVVTFPYSGVLVAVEVRRELVAFTWAFTRTAIGLVGFIGGFAAAQEHGTAAGLAAGWLAYAVCAAAVHRLSRSEAVAGRR
ncbi:hypothetical protein Ari01nite_30300 [Paractinoplanes rishiriensis]|uniref:Uncharacterized protein n=1 Tax=Paractinoplanes rishiriensis TaxID=1050105 RepID=A0A919JVF5_9ACTN|nr:hypothetical protein Ari01nite_30300 [Actinoplanes rishiriensis]